MPGNDLRLWTEEFLFPQDRTMTPKSLDVFTCNACGGKYRTVDLYVDKLLETGVHIRICKLCGPKLIQCDMCKTVIDFNQWDPGRSARHQCLECGSTKSITVKQKESFVPSDKILARRRGNWKTISF